MTVLDKIQQQFAYYTECHFAAAEMLPRAIEHASNVLSEALLAGNKIMTCGNAGAGLLAQYFASGLMNRFDKERPNLPALALTTDSAAITSIASLYNFDQIFARQLRAFGQEGDVLMVFTAQLSGNIQQAVDAARDKKIRIICLTSQADVDIMAALTENDVAIIAPTESLAHTLELQLQVVHALFAALDWQLFGMED